MPDKSKGIKNFIQTYINSPDTIISTIVSVALFIFLPINLDANFTSSFYNVGITVLSIIFSLFFAALAIIMSSTDNDFILYLEEEDNFTGLMGTFKVVLASLFLSLIVSIVFYLINDYYIKEHSVLPKQHKGCFILFQFLFCYSLIGTALSIKDTITFTAYRTKFLAKVKREREEAERIKNEAQK